jgi:hypothetical protein
MSPKKKLTLASQSRKILVRVGAATWKIVLLRESSERDTDREVDEIARFLMEERERWISLKFAHYFNYSTVDISFRKYSPRTIFPRVIPDSPV